MSFYLWKCDLILDGIGSICEGVVSHTFDPMFKECCCFFISDRSSFKKTMFQSDVTDPMSGICCLDGVDPMFNKQNVQRLGVEKAELPMLRAQS